MQPNINHVARALTDSLSEMGFDTEDLPMDGDLESDLGLDSIEQVELLALTLKRLGIDRSTGGTGAYRTPRDLVLRVASMLAVEAR